MGWHKTPFWKFPSVKTITLVVEFKLETLATLGIWSEAEASLKMWNFTHRLSSLRMFTPRWRTQLYRVVLATDWGCLQDCCSLAVSVVVAVLAHGELWTPRWQFYRCLWDSASLGEKRDADADGFIQKETFLSPSDLFSSSSNPPWSKAAVSESSLSSSELISLREVTHRGRGWRWRVI